jgi:Fe-S-cluster containining protein
MPGIWKLLLPEDAMWLKLPQERLATCSACYKVALGEYRPDCQCCTHFPQIPNFMLGLALQDPASRDAVSEVIARGHALPQGLVTTPRQLLDAAVTYSDDRFGNESSLVCPFVDPESLGCRVYPYRNSICSTFFCEHDHGGAGTAYWDRLQALVGHIEIALSQWTMDQVGLGSADYVRRLDALATSIPTTYEEGSGAWSKDARRYLWADWYGRELVFFERCVAELLARQADLYEIAVAQPFREALAFERAVRAWIPPAYRDEVPAVAKETGQTTPIEDLWYKLQLATRNLWALPFGEGRVVLADAVRLEPNPMDDAAARRASDKSFALIRPAAPGPRPALRLFLTEPEVVALRLFQTPQSLGEQLFETDAIRGLDDPRGFLAECMRRDVLTRAPPG